MSGSLPMAVDARHLTYRYGQFTAVDDVTLQVRPGETMGLLGPNGAGKTTMVRMLTTLTPVQHGELRIFGMDARHADHRHPKQHRLCPATTFDRAGVDGPAERGVVRAVVRRAPRRARRARRRGAGRPGIARRGRSTGGDLLRRHGAPPGSGSGTGQPPVAAGARRTDRRAGPDRTRRRLDAGAEDAGPVRHDRAADHPLHGRGRRVVRPGRADASRCGYGPWAHPPS